MSGVFLGDWKCEIKKRMMLGESRSRPRDRVGFCKAEGKPLEGSNVEAIGKYIFTPTTRGQHRDKSTDSGDPKTTRQ